VQEVEPAPHLLRQLQRPPAALHRAPVRDVAAQHVIDAQPGPPGGVHLPVHESVGVLGARADQRQVIGVGRPPPIGEPLHRRVDQLPVAGAGGGHRSGQLGRSVVVSRVRHAWHVRPRHRQRTPGEALRTGVVHSRIGSFRARAGSGHRDAGGHRGRRRADRRGRRNALAAGRARPAQTRRAADARRAGRGRRGRGGVARAGRGRGRDRARAVHRAAGRAGHGGGARRCARTAGARGVFAGRDRRRRHPQPTG
jgi:hypothetical protein